MNQRRLAYILLCFIGTIIHASSSAQQYLEFIENKGQWHSSIQYKGELPTGAFALKPDGGYKMLLYNQSDVAKRNNAIHHASNINHTHGNDASNAIQTQSINNNSSNNTVDGDVFVPVRGHVYEVKFLNANLHPTALPDKKQNNYHNYFIGNDSKKWASDCKIYGAVTYQNIYPNIDVRYYTDKGNLKYDFIVHPGGDYKKIALYFEGANNLQLKNGELIVKTTVDEVKEKIPYTYQIGFKQKKELKCDFVVKGNIVQFQIQEPILPNETLVIDPQLIFSTFSGSRSSNWGFTSTYDGGGNFFAGGVTFGANFPITNGAFQTSYGGGNSVTGEGGGFDIGIMKFDPNGSNLLYSTFLGGSGNDYPHSLIVDGNNNLVIAGKTTSRNYPTNRNTFGSGGGVYDIMITKLNSTGASLVGSILIGGSGDDGVNIRNKYTSGGGTGGSNSGSTRRNYGDDSRSEVIVDEIGNIYLASCTQSTDFPTTLNAFQRTNGGKNAISPIYQDGVVIKTSPDLSTILFSSFLGGDRDDAAFVLTINPFNNNILVAGGTQSANFPGDKSGVKFPFYQGGDCDGFVTEISNDGSTILKTSYFGTDGADIIYGIQFDRFGFPYVMGTTTGTTNWVPTANAAFRQIGGKQFIMKLKKDLSDYEYLTTFGTNSVSPNISPTAFLVDRCENVYVSGWGGSGNTDANYLSAGTNGLPVTRDAYDNTTDGNDFYFFVLERNATSQLYGSFFGQVGGFGEHVDGGTSRFDREGVIYQALCANCGGLGSAFPVTGGAYSRTNNAASGSNGGCNLAAVKIAFNLAGVGGAIKSNIKGAPNRRSGCVPLEVDFSDSLALGKKFIWNFGDGSPEVTTTTPTTKHTYNIIGSYLVRLISIDSSTCNIADTSYLTITARNDEAKLDMSVNKVGVCTQLSYQFTNQSTAPAGKPFSSNSFNLLFGDGQTINLGSPQSLIHTYNAPGTYRARLLLTDTNYCNAPDSLPITLRIAPLVKAGISTSPTGCAPYDAVIINTSIAGTEFFWDFGDGTTFFGADPPPHRYQNIGVYTITLRVNDTATCNKTDVTSFTITVNDKPTSQFSYSPQPPQANTPVSFTNSSLNGIAYKWLFGDGDSLVTNNINEFVSHIYNATSSYMASLIVTNSSGCKDTSTQEIRAIVFPLLDVPTAFTPNNDGNNDKIFVRGFGIEKMNWKIYNRWGVLMFESNSQKIGWDGRYKSVVQPQDVYTYSLDVTYSDGQRYTKTGDITLLR